MTYSKEYLENIAKKADPALIRGIANIFSVPQNALDAAPDSENRKQLLAAISTALAIAQAKELNANEALKPFASITRQDEIKVVMPVLTAAQKNEFPYENESQVRAKIFNLVNEIKSLQNKIDEEVSEVEDLLDENYIIVSKLKDLKKEEEIINYIEKNPQDPNNPSVAIPAHSPVYDKGFAEAVTTYDTVAKIETKKEKIADQKRNLSSKHTVVKDKLIKTSESLTTNYYKKEAATETLGKTSTMYRTQPPKPAPKKAAEENKSSSYKSTNAKNRDSLDHSAERFISAWLLARTQREEALKVMFKQLGFEVVSFNNGNAANHSSGAKF